MESEDGAQFSNCRHSDTLEGALKVPGKRLVARVLRECHGRHFAAGSSPGVMVFVTPSRRREYMRVGALIQEVESHLPEKL